MAHTRALAILFLAAAAGCGHKEGSSTATPTSAEPAPTPAEPTPEAPKQPATSPPAAAPIRVEGGFVTPESVLFDAKADRYYVTNINGSPLDKDGNGFISRVTPDGTIEQLKWIEGLNAPKGMALVGDTLYVTDIDVVRTFDVKTGKATGEIAIKGATFLNDLTADADKVYVSDMGMKLGEEGFGPSGTDAVWVIDDKGAVTELLKDSTIPRPNGLYQGDALYLVTYGANELRKVQQGSSDVLATLPTGALDGVAMHGDDLFISSWECSCVYRGKPTGPFEIAVKDVKSPADIGWDSSRKRLLIPLFEENAVLLQPIEERD